MRLILTVLLGGLVAGIGVAYFLHQLRPVFTSTRQLTELTQLPVLGSVSMTWLERHKAAGPARDLGVLNRAVAALVVLALFTLAIQGPTARLLQGLMA